MRILFQTNINAYKSYDFPEVKGFLIPRKGDTIMVISENQKQFRAKMMPVRLEVVDVVWHEHAVVCELHYKQIDIQIAKQNGVNLF